LCSEAGNTRMEDVVLPPPANPFLFSGNAVQSPQFSAQGRVEHAGMITRLPHTAPATGPRRAARPGAPDRPVDRHAAGPDRRQCVINLPDKRQPRAQPPDIGTGRGSRRRRGASRNPRPDRAGRGRVRGGRSGERLAREELNHAGRRHAFRDSGRAARSFCRSRSRLACSISTTPARKSCEH
jgi:hypothetical protein